MKEIKEDTVNFCIEMCKPLHISCKTVKEIINRVLDNKETSKDIDIMSNMYDIAETIGSSCIANDLWQLIFSF